jgi:hypothetical protein
MHFPTRTTSVQDLLGVGSFICRKFPVKRLESWTQVTLVQCSGLGSDLEPLRPTANLTCYSNSKKKDTLQHEICSDISILCKYLFKTTWVQNKFNLLLWHRVVFNDPLNLTFNQDDHSRGNQSYQVITSNHGNECIHGNKSGVGIPHPVTSEIKTACRSSVEHPVLLAELWPK